MKWMPRESTKKTASFNERPKLKLKLFLLLLYTQKWSSSEWIPWEKFIFVGDWLAFVFLMRNWIPNKFNRSHVSRFLTKNDSTHKSLEEEEEERKVGWGLKYHSHTSCRTGLVWKGMWVVIKASSGRNVTRAFMLCPHKFINFDAVPTLVSHACSLCEVRESRILKEKGRHVLVGKHVQDRMTRRSLFALLSLFFYSVMVTWNQLLCSWLGCIYFTTTTRPTWTVTEFIFGSQMNL